MGWGSILGALGKVGAGIAAPFTGGASLAAIPMIDALGNVAGDAAKGSAGQRIAEAPEMARAYQANLQGTQLNDRRAMLASLLGGTQDASIGRPEGSTIPTFALSGGMKPSNFTNRDALMQQLGTQIRPLEMPSAGGFEKVLGGIGLGSDIFGAIAKNLPRSQKALSGPATPGNAADPSGVFAGVKMGNGFVDPGPNHPLRNNPYVNF